MTNTVTSTELVPILELSALQQSQWRGMQAANPALASPYFSLDFARLVAARRPDTHALVLKRNGQTAGFLPLHLSITGIARPLGGPLGDHHGLISDNNELGLRPVLESGPVRSSPIGVPSPARRALPRHAICHPFRRDPPSIRS